MAAAPRPPPAASLGGTSLRRCASWSARGTSTSASAPGSGFYGQAKLIAQAPHRESTPPFSPSLLPTLCRQSPRPKWHWHCRFFNRGGKGHHAAHRPRCWSNQRLASSWQVGVRPLVGLPECRQICLASSEPSMSTGSGVRVRGFATRFPLHREAPVRRI